MDPHTDEQGHVVSYHTMGLMIPEKDVVGWTVGLVGKGLEIGGVRRG